LLETLQEKALIEGENMVEEARRKKLRLLPVTVTLRVWSDD